MNASDDTLWRELAALDEPTVDEMAEAERDLAAGPGAPPLAAAELEALVARAIPPALPVPHRRRWLLAIAGALVAALSISWVARELWQSRRNSAFELDLPAALTITYAPNWTPAERLSAIGFVFERCSYVAEHLSLLAHDGEPRVASAALRARAAALQRLDAPAERTPAPCADRVVEQVQCAMAAARPLADRLAAIEGLQHLLEEGIRGIVGCELTGEADGVRDAFVQLLRERLVR